MCYVVLTTLVSCRQLQAAQSTLQQHITAAKSCDDKPHNLQQFTSYVLVVPGIFGLQTDAVGALPCLQLLLANPTEDLSPFRERMDVWITARTLLCVLAAGKQQSSNAAELSGSILHMLPVMFTNFDTQGLGGASLVCVVQQHSVNSHED